MQPLKVLDLFCGMGGWSKPFLEDGDEVIGIDIKNYGYPGQLILQDVRTLDGRRFKGFDLIIGSPPCVEFTSLTSIRWVQHGIPQNIILGFELIDRFFRIVRQAKPRFWAMENVRNLEKWMPIPKPIWRFKITKNGRRSLWGNLNIPLVNEYVSKTICQEIGWKNRPLRALIPYDIACVVRDAVRVASP